MRRRSWPQPFPQLKGGERVFVVRIIRAIPETPVGGLGRGTFLETT